MKNLDTSKAFSRPLRREILADLFSVSQWNALKKTYQVGDLRMICCSGIAVPKTSENGLQFFAHLAGECATAPETVWHKSAKAIIQDFCTTRGISCELEKAGSDFGAPWLADVYIEVAGKKIAIEIQHSYQHREKFFERQDRYKESGVDCFWLMNQKTYGTFLKTEANYRVREEHNGIIPKHFYACRADMPIAFLSLEPEVRIYGAGSFASKVDDWLLSIIEGRFIFNGRIWTISEV